MTPERFRQIEELYHAVREAAADERVALLARADSELRRQVESLLVETGGEDLDLLGVQDALGLLDETVTKLASGACLGPYRIESKLGEGGMGEVFRALDTRLGRAVAVKTAHKRFTARFEREARVISSLNHPNICTLYDVGPNYLVMELVEGETIAAHLKNGPLPAKTALRYAAQIAAALVEAHGKGIIHRDLKPGNIMVGKSGVKVLDFGLAKSGTDETVTDSHMVVGTPAYMAPEQRQGKAADARTDIYSFGCVLHEMLTGARVSAGRKRTRLRRIERIVSRCLEEDPGRRWQSVGELERELSAVAGGTAVWKVGAAVAAAVLAVTAGEYFHLHRAPTLTDKDTIILTDFDNKTGDPVFDDTLRQGLSVELQQSPILSLLPDTRIGQMLTLMGRPKDARLTPAIAQEVCVRTGSAAVLEGSIAKLGSQYILGLRARNCTTGSLLDQEQIQVPRQEDVLNSLSLITRKFRARVGESLAMVEHHSTPLEEATTASLEALKAYSTGMRLHFNAGSAVGIPFLRRAVEIDPQFAMAHANLSLAYWDVGKSLLSAECAARAWQLRSRTSERERYFIDFLYDRDVTGNLEKAYQTLESWYRVYPHGAEPPTPQDLLGGISTNGTGRYARAIEMEQKTIAELPEFSFGYGGLALSYFLTDRFAEAERTLQLAAERKMQNPNHLVIGYHLAVLKDDQEQIDRLEALGKGKPVAERRMAHVKAMALARSGRFRAAREFSSRSVDLALEDDGSEEAAGYRSALAVWEALAGKAAEGKRNAMAALELSKSRDVRYAAGIALAFSGESAQAEALAGDLEKGLLQDTFVRFTYVPVLRAATALARGKPADSVELLQRALPYELAANGFNFGRFYLGGLYSAYVRGEALFARRRYADAAAEFQKILDHRGIVGADPIGVLAHLQLGRVFASQGDKVRAKTAYEVFLSLWTDADPDIRILQQARAERTKL